MHASIAARASLLSSFTVRRTAMRSRARALAAAARSPASRYLATPREARAALYA